MKKKNLKKIDLTKIENPAFLKDLSYDELDLLSSDIRDYLLDILSKNGGHVSSNLGVIDTTISLCRSFDFLKDRIIFDVGHQTYTYKLLTGRDLTNIRSRDGVSGFQKISESPYDHFECGHSSTSISVANGMAISRDLNKENYEVIAFIGDGAVVNGLALEGLNNLVTSKSKVIIVLNDNDMSISKPTGAMARLFRKASTSHFYTKSKSMIRRIFPRFIVSFLSRIKNFFKRKFLMNNLFEVIGYKVIGPIDGHDIRAMDKAFAKAKRLDRSVVVHIKTIKGHGYKYAEDDQKGNWHGTDRFDIETGKILIPGSVSWSEYIGFRLTDFMEEHPETVLVASAMVWGSYLSKAFKKYPDRCYDVGIAEEHAVTLSGGLGQSGKHPIISIYSTFLQRAYDEILHDVARMNISSTFLVDRSGLVGKDGDTHQGLYDESFIINMPNTIVAMPANTSQVKCLLEESLKHNAPFFIRYPKEDIYESNGNGVTEFGKWVLKKEGDNKKCAIIAVGPLTECLYQRIKQENINVTLVNALYLKPFDEEMLKTLLDYQKIIIYNPYATINGFIQSIKVFLIDNNYRGQIVTMGVPNTFIKHATIKEQREELSLTVDDVLKNI